MDFDPKLCEAMGLRPEEAAKVRVLVMTGYGLNCEDETAAGFERLGCTVERRHVGDLIVEPSAETFSRWDVLAFIGGFSFGDHVASGRVYANRLRYRLGEGLARFVDRGGLAVGMCNGFQTMVKLGILPGLDRTEGALAPQQASLVPNERLGYYDGWVTMRADAKSPCVWTRGVELIDLPSRHGEGQLVYGSKEVRTQLQRAHQIPLCYVDEAGEATTSWPQNPNGSEGGAGALCDPSGRLFGLMPHPEAFLYAENHPRWRSRRDAGDGRAWGEGVSLLANGVKAALSAR
jgi:phosphoribosylformylglycinamidine synthase